MKSLARQMYRWGPRGVNTYAGIIALVVALAVAAYVYSRPELPIVGTPPATTQEKVVPATGDEGFNAKVFCEDSLTSVSRAVAPDASGATYEMKRLKNSVSESVVVVLAQTGDVLYAKHFWDEDGVQRSEPAFVDDDVKTCLERKS